MREPCTTHVFLYKQISVILIILCFCSICIEGAYQDVIGVKKRADALEDLLNQIQTFARLDYGAINAAVARPSAAPASSTASDGNCSIPQPDIWSHPELEAVAANLEQYDLGLPPEQRSGIKNDPPITAPPSPTTSPPFRYFLPYNHSQACNIFGPTCQKGMVTVDASVYGCKTTPSTLPCSSYLASQSHWLGDFNPGDPSWLEWQKKFGRSPECKSYASVMKKHGTYTFTGCPPEQTAQVARNIIPNEIPPGVFGQDFFRGDGNNHEVKFRGKYKYQNQVDMLLEETCCGNCTAKVPEVEIFYFPDPKAAEHCERQGRKIGYVGSGDDLTKLDDYILPNTQALQNLRENGISTMTVSGHTLTSPSVYMQVKGTLRVEDGCGGIGSTFTSPFFSFRPEDISTYQLKAQDMKPGYHSKSNVALFAAQIASGARTRLATIDQLSRLTVADLECPSLGVGASSREVASPWVLPQSLTIGPPYLPVVVPPPGLIDLDPEWKRVCTSLQSHGQPDKVGLFDPPRVLIPEERNTPEQAALPANQAGGVMTPASGATPVPAIPGQVVDQLPEPTQWFPEPPGMNDKKPQDRLVPGTSEQSAAQEEASADPADEVGDPAGSGADPQSQNEDSAALDPDTNHLPVHIENSSHPALGDHVPPGVVGSDPIIPGNPGPSDTGVNNFPIQGIPDAASQADAHPASDPNDPGKHPVVGNPEPGSGKDGSHPGPVVGSNDQPASGQGRPQGRPGAASQADARPASNQNDPGTHPAIEKPGTGPGGSKPGPVVGSNDQSEGGSGGLGGEPDAASHADTHPAAQQDGPGTLPANDSPESVDGSRPGPAVGSNDQPGGGNGVPQGEPHGEDSSTVPQDPSHGGSGGLSNHFPDAGAHDPSSQPSSGGHDIQPFQPDNNAPAPGGFNHFPINPAQPGNPDEAHSPGTSDIHANSPNSQQAEPFPDFTGHGTTPEDSTLPDSINSNPNPDNDHQANQFPGSIAQPVSPENGVSPNDGSSSPGTNHFPINSPDNPALPAADSPITAFDIASQPIHPNPTGFLLPNNIPIHPGGPAATVNGTRISLSPYKTLSIGSDSYRLSETVTYPPVTISNLTFTPSPSGFSINNTPILPGAPATTIANIPISLSKDGELIVGKTKLKLASPGQKFEIAGTSFVPKAEGFRVGDDAMVLPGGEGINIGGNEVRLDERGRVKLGGEDFLLPTTQVVGERVQAKTTATAMMSTRNGTDTGGYGSARRTRTSTDVATRTETGTRGGSMATGLGAPEVPVAQPVDGGDVSGLEGAGGDGDSGANRTGGTIGGMWWIMLATVAALIQL